MQHRWRLRLPLIVLPLIALLLGASCAARTPVVTVTALPETVVVTATPFATPVPTPTPVPERSTLTVCLNGEPDTLYLYGGSHLPAARAVMAALYDGPIDYVDYRYRPVILARIPNVSEGDVVTRRVRVHTGDRVVASNGDVVSLQEGMRVRPAGCYGDACAVEFDGQGLFMERLEVTFILKTGLKWSDGEPLTAADSVFAFQVASNLDTPGYRYLSDRTLSYRVLDDQRVKWMGMPGFINRDYVTNFFPPLPSHQLKGRSPGSLVRDNSVRRHPLGWGPYVVDEWVPGNHISLDRNKWYFRADEGLPAVDHVVFRFTSGPDEMVSQLVSGGCDVAVQDPGFEPLVPLLQQLDAAGLVNLAVGPSDSGWQLDFGISTVDQPRRGSLFADLRVRQGFAECIDRRAIVDQVTSGLGTVPDGFAPHEYPGFAEARFAHWDYNPAAGRALLEEVGWLDQDGDGILEAERVDDVREGTPFVVTLLVPQDDHAASQAAQMIRSNLIDCGVRVDLENVFYDDLSIPGPNGLLYGRHFDLALTKWQARDVLRCERYLSSEIPVDGHWAGMNVSGYANPEYDTLCLQASASLPGMTVYQTRQRQVLTLLSDELPSLPLFMGARIALVHPGISGLTLDATSDSELWNIEELSLK